MNDSRLVIDCAHGKGIASIVCGHHLVLNQPLGFIENCSDPDDLRGWCYACEYLFQQEGEMTTAFKKFNDAKVACEKCFCDIKRYHSIK